MQFYKLSLFIPALMIVGAGAFADQSAIPPQGYPPQEGYPPQQGYPPQGYPPQQGYPPPQQYPTDPCYQCGGPQLPNVYPAPHAGFDPGAQYYCDPYNPCARPVVPYGPPPVVYNPQPLPPPPILVQPAPYYGRPIFPRYPERPMFGGPGVGGPGFGGPGFGGPIGGMPPHGVPPGGHPIHHISAQGCEVQQGNSGQFSVISTDGQTIYSNKSSHAEANAEYMKSYYEKSLTGLCGTVQKSDDALDI